MSIVLKTTLEKNGQYGKLKAELQVQLMRSLGLDKQLANSQKPQPPSNVSLANQIVCEYLNWAGLKFSEMIFSAGKIRLQNQFATNLQVSNENIV